jgi:[acyl-carrier-protein] S-malonyltransferase
MSSSSAPAAPAPVGAGVPGLPAPGLVGWVRGEPVTLEMVTDYLREHPAPPALAATGDDRAMRRWAARSLMAELVLRNEAAQRGLATDSDLQAAVATEVAGDGQPTDAEVASYMERNRDRYTEPERRWVRHVLCTDEPAASVVARRARSGQAVEDLARRFSTDAGSRGSGGDLGPLCRGELAGELENLVFGAGTGEVLGPVPSPFGWHVLVVYAIEPRHTEGTASARAAIAAELALRNRSVAYAAWLERRMLEDITVAPGYDHPARPGLLDRVHRH